MMDVMPKEGRPGALSLAVQVAAVVAAGAALVAVVTGSDLATEVIMPLALVALLGGILVLARLLERYRRVATARAVDETEARTMRILDRSNEAYIALDADGVVTAWNAAAETIFGWRRAEAIGRDVAQLIIPPDQRELHRAGIKRYHETGDGPMLGPRTEVIAMHRDGAQIPVDLSIIAIEEGANGTSFHGFARDITERKLLETQQAEMLEAAQETARLDVLTSLPNRRGWDETLKRELARARRERTAFCVTLIDLDHFKSFNDTNGHQAGDRLLRRAASAWKLALRQSDVIARYGGEEFAVLLPVCELDEAMEVTERLREATPEGQTVSAGVAQWNGYESEEALIDRVDLALYNAKREGRDRTTAAA
jgi:diguanylate cyclase (GGDEF)-like protein/PAS domain S-box-containing protein